MNGTFCRTKAGNGYRTVGNGKWFYVSKIKSLDVITDLEESCQLTCF